MNVSLLMTLQAIVAIVFGAVLIVMPHELAQFYGRNPLVGAEYIAGLYGAALVGVGVISISARNATDSEAGQAVLLGLFVGALIALILVLIGQLEGSGTPRTWINVGILGFFTLGFGYFRFMKSGDGGGDA